MIKFYDLSFCTTIYIIYSSLKNAAYNMVRLKLSLQNIDACFLKQIKYIFVSKCMTFASSKHKACSSDFSYR